MINRSIGKNIPNVQLMDYHHTGKLIKPGDLLDPEMKGYPKGSFFNLSQKGYRLLICLDKPTLEEIRGIIEGEIEFLLVVEKDIIDLVYRIGDDASGMPWSDSPYNWHLNPVETRWEPEFFSDGSKIYFDILLVDSSTGILKAHRAIMFSPEFTSVLFNAILAQIKMPFDKNEYFDHVDTLYRKYSSRELVYRSMVRMLVPPLN